MIAHQAAGDGQRGRQHGERGDGQLQRTAGTRLYFFYVVIVRHPFVYEKRDGIAYKRDQIWQENDCRCNIVNNRKDILRSADRANKTPDPEHSRSAGDENHAEEENSPQEEALVDHDERENEEHQLENVLEDASERAEST